MSELEKLKAMREELTKLASIDKPWLKYYSKEIIEKDLPKMNIYDYIYENNKDYLGRIALNYFGRKITYGEMFNNIERTAKALKEYGINKGDIVTISMPTTPELVYLFYALSKIGAISNMIDPRTSDLGIEEYLKEADSKLLITIDMIADKLKPIVKKTNVDKVVLISAADSLPIGLNFLFEAKEMISSIGKKKEPLEENYIKWNSFIKSGENYKGKTTSEYEKNSPVVIVHTGGTTGLPKGVVLSNDNINAAAFQCRVTGLNFQREHVWLDFMPPFIAYGIGNGLHLPLVIGMQTILIPKLDAKTFDKLINKHKPNHFAGVPSHWGTMVNSKVLKNADLSYIKAPIVGGDSMDTTLEGQTNKFLNDHNCDVNIIKGYGMTEVCAAVSVCISNECNEIGSVGIPFVKTIISIFNPDTHEELPYGKNEDGTYNIGEVCIQGPNDMLGYFNNEDATNKIKITHKDGTRWIHSGDLGYMDEDGKLFILGRSKNMIIRSDGFKVYPKIIEDVILSHPAVKNCKVVGVSDPEHSQGKLPKAHFVLDEIYMAENKLDEKTVIEEIKEICLHNLAEYQQPCDFKARQEMPLTPIGKVDFRYLELEDINVNNVEGPVLKKQLTKNA